jgi:tetratricopeptide (TPR) repeat protein
MSDRANLGIRERKMDLELIVEQWLLYNMVAVSYKAIGKTKEAIHFLLEGIEKHPQCTSLHINAAIIYYDAKESDKAFSHAKRILQIVKDQQDEDTIEMLQNAADLFVAVGFLQGALLLYEQVFSCLFLMQQQEKIIIVKEQQEEIQSKIQEIKHYLGSTTS